MKSDPERADVVTGTPIMLPRPDFHFSGSVGRTYLDSDPAQFPQPVKAPKGAPNIVLILLDDAGFGQFSTFGGGVPSPTMERLAKEAKHANGSVRYSALNHLFSVGVEPFSWHRTCRDLPT